MARAKSIQAQRKTGQKSGVAKLQAETLRKAYNNGTAWTDEEVAVVVAGIERDITTFDIAISIGRSYYGTSQTRRTVGFALRHQNAIWGKRK